MDRETNNLVARQYLSEKNLGLVQGHEFADWAAKKLKSGEDTPNLRKLSEATDDCDPAEVDALFRECVSELGWEMPGKKSALKQFSRSIMQSVIDGDIEPYDGCSQLYVNSIFLGHPEYLYNWNYLFWSMEDLKPEELNRLIVEEVERSLGLRPPPPVEDIHLSVDVSMQPKTIGRMIKDFFGLR